MAFVSITEIKKYMRDDKRCVGPTVTVNSFGTAYISRAVYGSEKPSSIDVEVDIDEKIIRLKTGNGFSKKLTGRVGHTFCVPVFVRRQILSKGEKTIKIRLTKSEDGWWYGSYEEPTNDQ
ncbi:TPA: hypothetical protein ACRXX2_003552 [Klebsiella pneumoniae]|nr:hypothetical protein [Klebsiella pneumoniae]